MGLHCGRRLRPFRRLDERSFFLKVREGFLRRSSIRFRHLEMTSSVAQPLRLRRSRRAALPVPRLSSRFTSSFAGNNRFDLPAGHLGKNEHECAAVAENQRNGRVYDLPAESLTKRSPPTQVCPVSFPAPQQHTRDSLNGLLTFRAPSQSVGVTGGSLGHVWFA